MMSQIFSKVLISEISEICVPKKYDLKITQPSWGLVERKNHSYIQPLQGC